MIFRHRLVCTDTLYIILLYKTISCERVKTERCPRLGGEEVDFRTSPEYQNVPLNIEIKHRMFEMPVCICCDGI